MTPTAIPAKPNGVRYGFRTSSILAMPVAPVSCASEFVSPSVASVGAHDLLGRLARQVSFAVAVDHEHGSEQQAGDRRKEVAEDDHLTREQQLIYLICDSLIYQVCDLLSTWEAPPEKQESHRGGYGTHRSLGATTGSEAAQRLQNGYPVREVVGRQGRTGGDGTQHR